MSRLSEEFLRQWDGDLDAGFRHDSPFTVWWSRIVQISISESINNRYTECVKALEDALSYTVRGTQSDIGYVPLGLSRTMRAMELWRGCDANSVPNNPEALDLEDLDQAILLIAFQFDSVMGTDKWVSCLDRWFEASVREVRLQIALGAQTVEVINQAIDEGEETNLDTLDDAHWVLSMLEWLKLEDPRRDVGIDLIAVGDSLTDLEEDLRPVLPNLRRAGEVMPDPLAPRSFWWRH